MSAPDPQCPNCDGCGCMDCGSRTIHNGCVWDCPVCSPSTTHPESDAPVLADRLEDDLDEITDRYDRVREAIGRHFAQLRTNWVAVIVNDDGDLQAVDEVLDGDFVVYDGRSESGQS